MNPGVCPVAMDKVQHFEIPADDMARAKKFYGSVFGWRIQDVPGMGNERRDHQEERPTCERHIDHDHGGRR